MSGNRHISLLALQALLVLNVICISNAQGQFGNEWIEPGQSYYKIPVGQTGMYAVTFAQLNSAGVPASFTTAPDFLQLFHRGVEQAVHISNDTLFFYGQKNDGTLDSILYEPNMYQPLVNTQPHKYYNLHSDTTAYFLTWSATVLGKRMSISNLSSAASPDVYHHAEILSLFINSYDQGYKYSSETYLTPGDQGEGWFGNPIYQNPVVSLAPVDYTHALTLSSVHSAAGLQADLEVMLVGRNGSPSALIHNIDILIGNPSSPDYTFSVPAFAFHDVKKHTVQIPASYLTNGTLNVTIRNKGQGTVPSSVSPAYIKFSYPQSINMQGASDMHMHTLANGSFSNIEISNPSSESKIYDVTDKDNVVAVTGTLSAGLLKATLSASSTGHRLYIVNPSAYLSVSSIKSADLAAFTNGATAEYIIITNKKIITGAREYAVYRASNTGGAYDTLLAEVEKLYNIYSYGESTPVAIRRFIAHLFDIGDPKYLFIIGKGLTLNYSDYRRNPLSHIHHSDPNHRRENLVPCYGVPCSDLLYSMGLNGNPKHVAALPTGRLSAKSDQEVRDYLDKVTVHEATPNALWRKNLIHLSGGNYSSEKTAFYNNMVYLKNIVEDTLFGGKVVKIFSKKGNDAVDNELTSNVATEINKGLSYVTFFGHSSPGILDLDIGYASHDFLGYDNEGKYPMLFINGCASAHMFSRWSFAEDWILTPKRGAILTLGHTDAGYAGELFAYATLFYKNAFQKRALLGKPVGDVQVGTIQDFNAQYGIYGVVATATLQQMVIQGDPGVRMYAPVKTDYETNDNQVAIKSFDNKTVTAVSDSFAISIVVSNLGVDFGDSLHVTVQRTINGKVTNYGPVTYRHINYQDTILFVIRSKDAATFGENIFEITLDTYDSIPELDELNNTATLRYFIPLSGVTALFPKEYSIVNANPVTLVGQSTNLLVGTKDYFMELDTSYLFDSPVRLYTVINSGSLVKWNDVSLPVLEDSLVYYWRIRYNDITSGEDTLWGESSFIYINGSPEGWSQSEFPQFFNDHLLKVTRNISQRKWEFGQSNTNIYVRVVGNEYYNPDPMFTGQPFRETLIQLNGYNYENRFATCGANILFAVAFDKNTSLPYSPYPNSGGGITCGYHDNTTVNRFNNLQDGTSAPGTTNQNQANLMAYIDSLPTGDYVILGNSGDAYFSSWTPALKDKIKTAFGAKFLDSLSDGMPYILVAKKGDANPLYEVYDTTKTVELIYKDTLNGSHNVGYITSTLIGPAESWGTFYRTVKTPEPSDKYEIKIIGVDLEGNSIQTYNIPQHDTLDLTSIPNLNQYPYIRLVAEVKDTANLTPPQLTKWQVIYTGVPEGTMNPALIGLSQYSTITKQEGDSITVCYAFENISNYDFSDTLQVKYTITNTSTGATTKVEKLLKLKQDSVLTFCYTFSTVGLLGNNILQAYVNPKIVREQYYNNNIIEMSFIIEKDNTHPILDVVFDGVHIMDGDIVSPNPMITITLNDENRYLIRNSTDDMEVYLQRPGDPVPQKVDFTSSEIISAKQIGTNGRNSYQIEYNPKNLPDGVYTLVVRGKDVAGNSSGAQDYRISFEVINESTITNFYPYPNPFSTSTRFVFTLTGGEIPEDMKIQIMTISGKVVREIMKSELGALRIGNNKTDFSWDGTDEFGDKLANGVYLYRVILKNSADFKHRESAGDKAFKKSFGKLYILR